jgi:hypothetical protein
MMPRNFIFGLLALSMAGHAATNTATWSNPNPPGRVEFYRVYWGSNVWIVQAPITNLSIVTTGAQRFNVSVEAVSTNGQRSDMSNVVPVDIPAAPVLQLNGIFQSAPFPSGPWTTITNCGFVVEALEPARFYRLAGNLR